jgi:hypothetical protein
MGDNIRLSLIKAVAFIVLITFSSFSNTTDRIKTTTSDNNLPVNLTAEDIVNRLVRYTGVTWNEETVYKFKAGSPGTKITGVATTFLATLDVMKKAIIYLGHVVSEENGMKYLAEDLQNVFPELPVKFIPAGNPFN